MSDKPFFVSVPHSGEEVPEETPWLKNLPENVLMCDVDRYVDRLYEPAVEELNLPHVFAQWHRYVVDLNRFPDDVDADSVQDSANPAGQFPIGFHWSQTTQGDRLIHKPMPQELSKKLEEKYYRPFHQALETMYESFHGRGNDKVYHLDAHSMPSVGTSVHRDPGQTRPEIVVGDVDGASCEKRYTELVMDSYREAGFEVALNWPYRGGRVTQIYGKPESGRHAIQVEMSRALYMNETTKKWLSEEGQKVQEMVRQALRKIVDQL